MKLGFPQKLVISMFVLLIAVAVVAAILVKPPETRYVVVGVAGDTLTLYELAEKLDLQSTYFLRGKPYNLKVKVQHYAGLDELSEAFKAGEVDAVVLRVSDAALFVSTHNDSRIIGVDLVQGQLLLASQGANISGIDQAINASLLEKLGYVDEETFYLFAAYLKDLYNYTIDPAAAVKLAPEEAGEALATGRVEALVAGQPLASILVAEYNFTVAEWFPNLALKVLGIRDAPETVIVVKSSMVELEPDKLQALIDLRDQAVDTWLRDVPTTSGFLNEKYNLSERAVLNIYSYLQPPTSGALDDARIKAIKDLWNLLYDEGYLKVDPTTISDKVFEKP